MRKSKWMPSLIFLCVASFLAGTRIGANAFIHSDAKYKAALAAVKLVKLQERDLESLKDDLEYELDQNMYQYARGQRSVLRYLWPELLDQDNSAISVAANYRIDNPGSYFQTESGEFDDMVKVVDEITIQYGKLTHNKALNSDP